MTMPALKTASTVFMSPIPATKLDPSLASLDGETFAGALDKVGKPVSREEQRLINARAEMEYMKKRIGEVGLAQFVEEQEEIKKLMKILHMLHSEEKSPDIKEHLSEYIDHFEEHPAHLPEEILIYIARDVASIPMNATNNLRNRMKEVFELIQKLSDCTMDELERMEKLQRVRND